MGWSIWIGVRGKVSGDMVELASENYTHNTNGMIRQAGIPDWPYDFLDNLRDNGKAGDMVEPLQRVLRNMRSEPAKYRAMNPPNGWGNYASLIPVLERLVDACEDFPDASVGHCS